MRLKAATANANFVSAETAPRDLSSSSTPPYCEASVSTATSRQFFAAERTIAGPTDGVPARSEFPAQINGHFVKVQDLRYGENPHQRAAFYRDMHPAAGSLVGAVQLRST